MMRADADDLNAEVHARSLQVKKIGKNFTLDNFTITFCSYHQTHRMLHSLRHPTSHIVPFYIQRWTTYISTPME